MFNTQEYWDKRYADGGTSGAGSYNRLCEYKAEIVNGLIKKHDIKSIIDFGCGDGNQLRHINTPYYLGVDVASAVSKCRGLFKDDNTKTFTLLSEYNGEKAEMTLSMDVIFHLVEDDIFEHHNKTLFNAATKLVVIYSSNTNDQFGSGHMRQRVFTEWIKDNIEGFAFEDLILNKYPYQIGSSNSTSISDFYIYKKGVKSVW